MPDLQERAREDSDSSSDEEGTGIEESKTDISYEEPQLLDSRTYTQVLRGNPASHFEPINYDKITNTNFNNITLEQM